MKPNKDVYGEASKKFNPYELCHYLVRSSSGEAIVDKAKLMKDKGEESSAQLCVILNADYLWDYKDFSNTTIYFYEAQGVLRGGVYDTQSGARRTDKPVAVPQHYGVSRLYQYEAAKLAEMIELVAQAS